MSTIGDAIGTGAVGVGMGMISNAMSNQSQQNQNQALINQQLNANKELTRYNTAMGMEMWRNTNYGPQIEEMKKAGVNPAMIYGKGGGGGTSTDVKTGNVQSGTAPNTGMAMLNAAMMGAQIKNIEADTKLKEQDAGYTSGAKTENTAADTTVKKGQATGISQTNKIQNETTEAQIDKIKTEAQTAIANLSNTSTNADINASTKNEQIKIIQQTAIGKVLENTLTRSNIRYTEAKIGQVAQDITNSIRELNLKNKAINVAEQAQNTNEWRTQQEARFRQQGLSNHEAEWATEQIIKMGAIGIYGSQPTNTTKEGYKDEEGGYWETTKKY